MSYPDFFLALIENRKIPGIIIESREFSDFLSRSAKKMGSSFCRTYEIMQNDSHIAIEAKNFELKIDFKLLRRRNK